MSWPLQAFILSKEFFDSVSFEEVNATFHEMREAGIARPPYEEFDVIVPISKIVRLVDHKGNELRMAEDEPGTTLRIRFKGFEPPASAKHFQWLFTRKGKTVDLLEWVLGEAKTRGFFLGIPELDSWAGTSAMVWQLIIVLLATRNIVKETKENKLLKLGIGSKEKNRYTTTLHIGRITESTESKPSGRELRPHLRRGHVRRQHYGPHNELVKMVFIEPVFVNADKGWIAERTAYNLIKEHKDEDKTEK